jgi:predicted double-glycine peptidase
MAMINMEFLKQTTPYGCGLYAIANVLGLRYYVTQERLEASKNGLHMAALNEYLKETAHTIFIDVLYCNSLGYKLPEEWLGITGLPNHCYKPFLFVFGVTI